MITPVTDLPGHDRRYAIDPGRISKELGWQPRHSFEEGLARTVHWYLNQELWYQQVRQRAGYKGERMGNMAALTNSIASQTIGSHSMKQEKQQ